MPESGRRPVCLLDLDGTLLTIAADKQQARLANEPWQAFEPAHGIWLNELHNRGVDVRYISDRQYAYDLDVSTPPTSSVHACHDQVGTDLHVPVFPEFDYVRRSGLTDMLGRLAAIRDTFSKQPLIWLDDELTPEIHQWAAERSTPTLLIQPDAANGLQPEHLSRVNTWLDELA